MRMISASDFQINCLRLLNEVAQNQELVLITQNGVPTTQLAPYKAPYQQNTQPQKPKSIFGLFKGKIISHGDIISPLHSAKL